MALNWLKRAKAYRHVKLESEKSQFYSAGSVRFFLKEGSSIVVNRGSVHLGFPLPGSKPFATFPETVVSMGENSRFICNGDVFIAPGASIKIGDNATVIFDGDNLIGHNFTMICTNEFHFGENSSLSWGVTMIDDDRHPFYKTDGTEIKPLSRKMIIGKNVGIQMNVIIPRGITIGENSIVSASVTLREDIPANQLIYQDVKLISKPGFTTGFGRDPGGR